MAFPERTLRLVGKIILGSIILLMLFLVLSAFFDIIVMLIISIFLALIFNPLVNFLENTGLKRILAVLIVLMTSACVLVFGFYFFIPKLINQINMISASLTEEKIDALFIQLEETLKHYIPFVDFKELSGKVQEFFSTLILSSIDNIHTIVSSIISVAALLVIIPFMTFFILKDKAQLVKGIVNIAPNRYFEFTYYVLDKIAHQLGRFVRGWIFDAFIVGFLSAIGLTILGIKNSITIGAIAGIGHLIPYFGPLIGGIPALIISLIQFGDLSMLPEITVMFVVVYTLDNGYIQPNIFYKSTDIHPLMIIVLILAGSQVMGILGMLLAVPAATVFKTAAREIYFGFKNYKIIRAHWF